MRARYDWEIIRAEYEAGASLSELSRRRGASRTAIQNHIRAEGWSRDAFGAKSRTTEAEPAAADRGPQKKAGAVLRAEDAKAAVILRHREEWERHRAIMDEALAAFDFERAKLAKSIAETLKIRQEGERRAWGIEDRTSAELSGGIKITWQS